MVCMLPFYFEINMIIFRLSVLLCFFTKLQAGVTDIPPVSSSDDEVNIETVTRDTLIPANLFDATSATNIEQKSAIETTSELPDELWVPDTNPIFRAIRDFIFQAGDGLLDTATMPDADPTEEIVKIIEKGLIEATTMLLAASEESNNSTTPTTEIDSEPVTLLRIEEENNLLDNIKVKSADLTPKQRQGPLSYVENMTLACTNCYSSLETCVQQCFTKHNCNDVQRQVRTCPPQPDRICNFFTQWSPEDECKVNEDCKSPLICCNDGCVNKCSPGIWRH